MGSLQLSPQTLTELIALIDDGTISGKIGKQLLPDLLQVGASSCVQSLQKGQCVALLSASGWQMALMYCKGTC